MTDEALRNRTESNGVNAASLESGSSPQEETADTQPERKSIWRRRITLISGLVTLIVAIIVLPPLINVSRYQGQVTALMSRSLGRPVHLSSVELRLLPRPGFVLHDLTVGEDSAFGAEPVLSARTVAASVRILSLWRGRIEISRVGVDDASLNVVRSEQGRWNLESLMLGAKPVLTAAPGGQRSAVAVKPAPFPYLEATNSRVNLKNGAEKSPFSIVNTDLSLWQDEPGQWRVRLSGQPSRTDIQMSQADAGDIRLEGTLKTAPQLRDMPLRLQVEWRDAQLGELSRLMLGSDSGWRGDMTADVAVQGTLDGAQTKARLRASGVRREEFSPETPLDFDANCSFRYQRSENAVHDLGCDTAIGEGRLHLKGEIPGNGGQPEGMLEVRQVPLQAGLDLLRTIRSDFAPGITARGQLNGELAYKVVAPEEKPATVATRRKSGGRLGHKAEEIPTNLRGTLTLEGGSIRGGELKQPLVLPRTVWAPTQGSILRQGAGPNAGTQASAPGVEPAELGTQFTIPMPALTSTTNSSAASSQAAAPQSITVRVGLGLQGYRVALGGSAPTARLRDLAYALGAPHLDAADNLIAGTADLDLVATGPWIAASDIPSPLQSIAGAASGPTDQAAAVGTPPGDDSLTGTMQLHHIQWKPPYLASAVEMPQGLVTVSAAGAELTSDFSFGAAKDAGKDIGKDSGKDSIRGQVHVTASPGCKAADCQPRVSLSFGVLDAGVLEAALLGAPVKKSLLSPLIDRMRSPDRPKWPVLVLNVQVESLVLGPVTLHKLSAQMKMQERDVALDHWDTGLLGGTATGTGHFTWAADSPRFAVDGSFATVDAVQLGALLGSKLGGRPLSGSGKVELSGLTAKDLAASATGDVQFNWPHGMLATGAPRARVVAEGDSDEGNEPGSAALVHFDGWVGKLVIKGGKAELGENAMLQGKRSTSVTGTIPFGGVARLSVGHAGDREAQVAAKARK